MQITDASPQSYESYRVSLVVPTRGRTWQVARLLDSLAALDGPSFEVILVDQNDDERLAAVLAKNFPFSIVHVHGSGQKGASQARNTGWKASSGSLVLFPDDDAWYPPDFLAHAIAVMEATGADLLTGRSVNTEGRTINGRYAAAAGPITPGSVWVKQIEWITLIRREVLDCIGGYDETVGIGGPTPWQAAEGPDLILRALQAGARCWYDPSVVAFHDELETRTPDAAMVAKGRAYGRGMGHVLATHMRTPLPAIYWLGRSLASLAVDAVKGRKARLPYLAFVLLGRWEGVTGRLWSLKSPVTFDGDNWQTTSAGGLDD